MKKEDTLIPATEFQLWCPDVESVLPRQSYFGRNTAFALDNLGDRLTLGIAKVLMNLGEDPNTFAQEIPEHYYAKNWDEERDVLIRKDGEERGEKSKTGKRIRAEKDKSENIKTAKRMRAVLSNKEISKNAKTKELEERKRKKKKSKKSKTEKKSRKTKKKSKRRESSSSSSSSCSSSSESDSSSESSDDEEIPHVAKISDYRPANAGSTSLRQSLTPLRNQPTLHSWREPVECPLQVDSPELTLSGLQIYRRLRTSSRGHSLDQEKRLLLLLTLNLPSIWGRRRKKYLTTTSTMKSERLIT
jgi:hypothetical protein